jgi:glycosyltransferase involved in cell wall biosynthesis
MRVLHVHSDLQWGGVEQWLLNTVHYIDRQLFQLDLFAATANSAWEHTIARHSLQLIRSPRPRSLWRYTLCLREALRRGKYDAVHCHFIDHSGLVLREAALAGVPVRIAHSHIDIAPLLGRAPVWARTYFNVQNRLLHRYATRGLAASREAARSMFGPQWAEDPRWAVLHCGINLEAFATEVDRAAVRREFGFGCEKVVFGHLGRFTEQKNHEFLVLLARQIAAELPSACFLWIGDGPLEESIRGQVERAGLSSRVVMAGTRSDAARLMRSMDAFLFPSRYEGLGLALVEAQAAGLRCFVADAVPAESTVVPELVTRMPLSDGPVKWAAAIRSEMGGGIPIAQQDAIEAVRRSVFNIEHSVRALEELYHECA